MNLIKNNINTKTIQYYITISLILLGLFDISNSIVYKDNILYILNPTITYILLFFTLYTIGKDIKLLNQFKTKLTVNKKVIMTCIITYDIIIIINLLANTTVIKPIHYFVVVTLTIYYIFYKDTQESSVF